MTKISEKIVFFGSGPVAAKSLQLLAQSFEIEAVVTKPRPAHHKGAVPVIEAADELGLHVHTVTDKATLDDLIQNDPFTSRLAILIDFGIIVSQEVIDYFPFGIINSHFSLLPEWRGADPITFSILSGQKQTGVSLMLLVEAMDEGPLLAQAPFDIAATTTTPQLTASLIELSAASLKQVVPLYIEGKIQAAPQEEATKPNRKAPSYSRKLTKDDGVIDWSKSAEQIEREIRAYVDWPKSRTKLGNVDVVITSASVHQQRLEEPGSIKIEDKQLLIGTAHGSLRIEKLKPAGKQEMTAQAFLAGYGDRLKD